MLTVSMSYVDSVNVDNIQLSLAQCQIRLQQLLSISPFQALLVFSRAVHINPTDQELWEEDLKWAHQLWTKKQKISHQFHAEQERIEKSSSASIVEINSEDEDENEHTESEGEKHSKKNTSKHERHQISDKAAKIESAITSTSKGNRKKSEDSNIEEKKILIPKGYVMMRDNT